MQPYLQILIYILIELIKVINKNAFMKFVQKDIELFLYIIKL